MRSYQDARLSKRGDCTRSPSAQCARSLLGQRVTEVGPPPAIGGLRCACCRLAPMLKTGEKQATTTVRAKKGGHSRGGGGDARAVSIPAVGGVSSVQWRQRHPAPRPLGRCSPSGPDRPSQRSMPSCAKMQTPDDAQEPLPRTGHAKGWRKKADPTRRQIPRWRGVTLWAVGRHSKRPEPQERLRDTPKDRLSRRWACGVGGWCALGQRTGTPPT